MATVEELEKRVKDLEQELQLVKMIAVGGYESLHWMPKSNSAFYQFNLIIPRTMDEKILWLRHNYWGRHPATFYINDKYLFKYYFATMFDDKYNVPLLGVWDCADDIDFDTLPDEFVLKRTLSGGSFEVKPVNKRKDDPVAIRRLARGWLSDTTRVKGRIIAEKKLEFMGENTVDYKFYVTYGKIMFLFISVMNKAGGRRTFQFWDVDFNNKLEIKMKHHSLSDTVVPKPECYDEMKTLAEEIGRHFPFIRVDLYESEGKVYVGELTDAPFNGRGPYDIAFDKKYGRMIDLPTEERIQQDFEETYKYFPELKTNPIFLDESTQVYRIIQPNNLSGSLPLPPKYFMQPMKQQKIM